jgi:hypothetical protein
LAPRSPARRHLLKLRTVVVPAVATLSSGPALAWHCKSPSAWGSEIINPNTSLANNAGHTAYIDETWSIDNWKTNTPRIAVDLADGTDAGAPWTELCKAFPGFKTNTTCSPWNAGHKKQVFNYQLVTVDILVTTCGFVKPAAISGSTLVKDLSSGADATYALIGQMNYAVLKLARFKNDIDMCLKDGQLGMMASGQYTENGQPWTMSKVRDYLYNNWVVRP